MKNFVLKGNVIYSENKDKLIICSNSYVVCENGICKGVFSKLPVEYRDFEVTDYGDKLIIPGLADLHVHAPQYAFCGLGMDKELLQWLDSYAFEEESKYSDLEYAARAYEKFVNDLAKGGTTRACIFGTLHAEATFKLMEILEKKGLKGYVGKVNMDRNCPEKLTEGSADNSEKLTLDWLEKASDFKNIKPILTPRFIPTCSDEAMEKLQAIMEKYDLKVQSHLSENLGEIEWVKDLHPDAEFYGQAYEKYGMFGGKHSSVMAHCVYSDDDEINLMKRNGVYVAHCPSSNTNLSSGIAPVRKFLDEGLNVGLGTDVAGGSSLSVFRAMSDAIQCSKLRWRLVDKSLPPLKMEEVFYMATKGGGSFFGKVGSFEEGYEFDAVVINDADLKGAREFSAKERLERFIYFAEDRYIDGKYVAGKQIF